MKQKKAPVSGSVIKVLPDAVANQIAAGEVVQRPASVVKELLENAIDAGAREITLNIQDAGRSLVQVIDDGKGMSETDARLCIERHATSKISSVDDIYHIHTMGFRGEAMASIAAVSQMEIKTKQATDELCTVIRMLGSEVQSQESEQGKNGTSIQVKNLFFNVPARRNFLKSNNIEYKHILETFQQIALGRPDIKFQLFHNGNESYKLLKANLRQRILQLFGKRFDERLVPISEKTDIVEIEGFVTKPDYATMKRGEQFFLVNDRFIKSPYLHHAVMLAFEDLLSKEMSPQYFIKLKIDPAQIDINIHPTKTEIKFQEERSIHAILRTTIRQALGRHNIAPSLDFERETAFDIPPPDKNRTLRMPEIKVDEDYNPFNKDMVLVQPNRKQNTGAIEKARDLYDFGSERMPKPEPDHSRPSKLNSEEVFPAERSKIIQLHNRYILTHIKSGFMVIDQYRAHQRILYERFISNLQQTSSSQQLLFPVLIELDEKDFETVRELMSDLERIGFSIGEMGKESISISGAPPGCDEKQIREIFTGTIDYYLQTGNKDDRSAYEKLALGLAMRMAVRPGQKLSEKEMEDLVDKLFACDMPYSLPNGKPIVITLPMEDLEKRFQL